MSARRGEDPAPDARAAACTIDELALADEPERWKRLGFDVADDTCRLGTVRVRLLGEDAGRGVLGWSLRGIRTLELDGLATTRSDAPTRDPAPEHPNGVLSIDHVVAFSPALNRTVAALEAAGLELRRIREEPTPAGAPRQAFFRLGAEILEVIQLPQERLAQAGGPDAPARLWGLALVVSDLERTREHFAPNVSEAREAVQQGRRIATVRRAAGLAVPVALMSVRCSPAAAPPR
jgi:hypothetical protein